MNEPALEAAPGAPLTHLLYLHGFRSSPQSTKARRVEAWVSAHRPDLVWHCPQLPPSPREAIELIMATIDAPSRAPSRLEPASAASAGRSEATSGPHAWPHERMAVIGSSLGGFYATVIAERTGCRAVLLNPAVDPARDLAAQIGEQTAWHGAERFFFRAEYIDELRALAPPARLAQPERYLAVIAKGDELLSWREMSARYAGCRIRLVAGSDHALSDFEAHLPAVIAFLGLRR